MVNCYWDPETLALSFEVRPSNNYSQEGTLEDYQAAVAEYKANQPQLSEPDWVGFNLAMIPPVGESDFEFWLDQFKILYQSSLATAAASGNAVETQRIYDLLKLQHPPTAEQVSAWQALADLHHIPLTF